MATFRNFLKRDWQVAFLYLVIAFSLYGWFLNNPFIMDDEIQVVENEHIHSLGNILAFFSSSTMGSGGAKSMGGVYYKPLLSTYYAIIWNFFGAQPSAYRAPTLTLFALSAFLIFLFSKRFFPKSDAELWSFFLGLLFLLHPANAEVVLYIADAQDVLYMFFGLLSLVLIAKIKSQRRLAGLLLGTFTLAILAKETDALFFAIGTFYAWLFARTKLKVVFGSAAAVFAVYLIARFSLGFTHVASAQLLFHNISYFERLKMLPLIVAHYLEIFFIPLRLSLTTDFVLQELTLRAFWLPLLCCFLAGLALLLMKRHWQKQRATREFSFFAFVLFLWFLLHTHVLVPLDGVYADRWLHIGTWVGVSFILISLSYLTQQMKRVAAALLIVAALFGMRVVSRAEEWSEALRLYESEVRLHPWDPVMNNNVGVELFRRGLSEEALPYFERATQLNPLWNVGWNNLAAAYEKRQDDQKAEQYYLKAISIPSYALAYENFTKLLLRHNRFSEARRFLDQEALPRFPYNQILLEIDRYLKQK